jgi:23S rRNA (cytosine1962-C5)-methyltransferase
LITHLLAERMAPRSIIVRPDAPVRRLEGLEVLPGYTAGGAACGPLVLDIGGLRFTLDPLGAQKTGFYIDQLPQYARIAAYACGRRVLDAFCNQGAFALSAARAGARQVTGIDSSRPALELARANALANGLAVEWVEENVFDWFTKRREDAWDLIILDPPPFVRSRTMLERGLSGYKEINLRALSALEPGGILATFSCSHHVRPEIFRDLVADAAADCGRSLRLLEVCRQPADHPVLLEFPESEYLTGLIVEVGGRLPGRRHSPAPARHTENRHHEETPAGMVDQAEPTGMARRTVAKPRRGPR